MWTKKQKLLVVFLNNSLMRFSQYEISSKEMKKLGDAELLFSDFIVRDSNIVDRGGFVKQVSEFIAEKPAWRGAKVLFVIPEEKVFLKGFELELGDLERKEELKKGFVSEVPFLEEELILRERLTGRVMEFSALHKGLVEDLHAPFIGHNIPLAGIISLPQVLALGFAPKEKTILCARYDNDLALVLSENASVLFSSTVRPPSEFKEKDIHAALKDFAKKFGAEDVVSVGFLFEDGNGEEVKNFLEEKGYAIYGMHTASILDFAGEYYRRNKDRAKVWDMLYAPKGRFAEAMRGSRISRRIAKAVLIAAVLGFGGWALWSVYQVQILELIGITAPPQEIPEVEEIIPEPIPEPEPGPEPEPEPIVIEKEDYPIQIFNGTLVAGEAARLRGVLQGADFAVSSIGNHEDQVQVRTTIFAGSAVPEELVAELRAILEAEYEEVVVSPSPVASEVIHIVIGQKR